MDAPNSCEVCARELPRSSQNRVLTRKDVCTFLLTAMASCLCLGRWCSGGKQQVCCQPDEQITCTTCSRIRGLVCLCLPSMSWQQLFCWLQLPCTQRAGHSSQGRGLSRENIRCYPFFSGHTGNVVGKTELLGSCFAGNAGMKPTQNKSQRGRSSQAAEEQSLSLFFALPVFLCVWMSGSPGCHVPPLLKLINQL